MIQMAQGGVKKVIAARISTGENVMEGLKQICEKYNINNGVILSGIGSLDGLEYLVPVILPDKKAGYGYGAPLHVSDPISVTNISGMICHDDAGETLLHIHISGADNSGTLRGGHLTDNNKVLLTLDVLIAELDGVEMGRAYDDDLEVMIFSPR